MPGDQRQDVESPGSGWRRPPGPQQRGDGRVPDAATGRLTKVAFATRHDLKLECGSRYPVRLHQTGCRYRSIRPLRTSFSDWLTRNHPIEFQEPYHFSKPYRSAKSISGPVRRPMSKSGKTVTGPQTESSRP